MISFTLDIAPVAKERARVTRHGSYTPAKTRRFESEAAMLMRVAIQGANPLCGPIKLTVRFVIERPARPKFKDYPAVRPDLDNYVKAIKDAANGILWVDDGQVYHIDARKLYDMSGGKPRIEMQLEESKEEKAT